MALPSDKIIALGPLVLRLLFDLILIGGGTRLFDLHADTGAVVIFTTPLLFKVD